MDIAEIWKLENKNDFICAMSGYLCNKCEYGDNIEVLSKEERVIYVVNQLEEEVNNGGFSQYFFNNSGDFANEVADALRTVGADSMAEICKKACSVFGEKVPERVEERRIELANEQTELLDQCDDEFYQYPDDLLELSYQYIVENKEQFKKRRKQDDRTKS